MKFKSFDNYRMAMKYAHLHMLKGRNTKILKKGSRWTVLVE